MGERVAAVPREAFGGGPSLWGRAPSFCYRARTHGPCAPRDGKAGRASQAGARGLSAFRGPRGPSPPPPARPPPGGRSPILAHFRAVGPEAPTALATAAIGSPPLAPRARPLSCPRRSSPLALPASQAEAAALPGRPRVVDAPMLAPESFFAPRPEIFRRSSPQLRGHQTHRVARPARAAGREGARSYRGVVCVSWRRGSPAPSGAAPRIVVPRAARGPRARRAAANLENRILRSMRSTSDSRLAKLEQRFNHERRFGPKRIQISEPGRAGPRGTPITFFEMHLNRGAPLGGHRTESSILAQDERWRRA